MTIWFCYQNKSYRMFTLDSAKKMIHGQKWLRWLDKMENKCENYFVVIYDTSYCSIAVLAGNHIQIG